MLRASVGFSDIAAFGIGDPSHRKIVVIVAASEDYRN
jgi:hypothetical protein